MFELYQIQPKLDSDNDFNIETQVRVKLLLRMNNCAHSFYNFSTVPLFAHRRSRKREK